MDFNTWDVKIQGESTLDFTYVFLEGSFIQIPITGDPIQGTLIISLLSVKVIRLLSINLKSDLIEVHIF